MSKDLEDITLIKSIPAFLLGLARTDCKARKGDLRCSLDAVHRDIGFSHLHIEDDGVLTWWRD